MLFSIADQVFIKYYNTIYIILLALIGASLFYPVSVKIYSLITGNNDGLGRERFVESVVYAFILIVLFELLTAVSVTHQLNSEDKKRLFNSGLIDAEKYDFINQDGYKATYSDINNGSVYHSNKNKIEGDKKTNKIVSADVLTNIDMEDKKKEQLIENNIINVKPIEIKLINIDD